MISQCGWKPAAWMRSRIVMQSRSTAALLMAGRPFSSNLGDTLAGGPYLARGVRKAHAIRRSRCLADPAVDDQADPVTHQMAVISEFELVDGGPVVVAVAARYCVDDPTEEVLIGRELYNCTRKLRQVAEP